MMMSFTVIGTPIKDVRRLVSRLMGPGQDGVMTTSGAGALELDGHGELLADLKSRVRATQFRAARAANTEVLRLYWSIGHDILERQAAAGWGSKVVTRLAADLQREFPDQRGWSRRNLLYMRKAAEVWPTEPEFVHHVGARLPWRHVTVLLDRLESREERDWYAAAAAESGWTRGVLELRDDGAVEPHLA